MSVQFEESVAGMDLETFTYVLVDKISGQESKCTLCKSEKVPTNDRLLKFSIDSYREIVSAKLKVTYPVNRQLKKTRLLGSSDDTKTLVIDDLYLSGRAGQAGGAVGAAKKSNRYQGLIHSFQQYQILRILLLGIPEHSSSILAN